MTADDQHRHDHDIAIVGLACRFPRAVDYRQFWANLRDGVEAVTFFSDEEMMEFGVEPRNLTTPGFVRAAPVLEDDDLFDARFFGYSPREAALLDPQVRVFLQLAWTALEDAGYDPLRYPGMIGVFGGMSMSSYLLFHLMANPRVMRPEDHFPLMIANDKDFLTTRVSYHLNLRGPSLDVQTGCSTSLVATHLACESLLSFQSDLVLAGGVSVQVPSRRGHFYEEGGVSSPDGHTRAFDERGGGTTFGSGAGIVVLKRMADALADGDTIRAVIRGSAINNDGSAKVGFTAPGVDGQAEVIARAHAMAEVDPASIGYVEAHGTGTGLGDPIEVSALNRAFTASGPLAAETCGLGSVKTNIGHLDAAAGVAGLIKTVLALEHGELPPSLNFERPNSKIDFAAGPFRVQSELAPWSSVRGPRRAGVSSFGIGGTNAHVVVEEAPPPEPGDEDRRWQILPLSAKSPGALDSLTAHLADHLEGRAEQVEGDDGGRGLADVAHTLQVGRAALSHRRVAVAEDLVTAAEALRELDSERVWTGGSELEDRPVVFMFPGGGAQHFAMGRDLYRSEPIYRRELDRCLDWLRPELGSAPREVLGLDGGDPQSGDQRIREPELGLAVLFSVEVALARLWRACGVEPEAMIGHSLGEYVAACVSGVFSVEDGLSLVLERGRLIESLPAGSMLSLALPEDEIRELAGTELSIAALNGPGQAVLSGPTDAVDALAERLEVDGVEFRQIQVAAAGHSSVMDPILDRLEGFVSRLRLSAPRIPYVSNVTGTWIAASEATSPSYWARHLRNTVRFGDGLRELAGDPARVFLEVGPGRNLTTLARLQLDLRAGQVAIPSMRHPMDEVSDQARWAESVGRLWLAGVPVDFERFAPEGARRLRVPLPTYPFEGDRLWVEPRRDAPARREGKIPKVDDWFYLPSWRRTLPTPPAADTVAEEPAPTVVFSEGAAGDALAARLEARGHATVRVVRGEGFSQLADDLFAVDPRRPGDFGALWREVTGTIGAPGLLVHLWSLGMSAETTAGEARERGLYGLLHLAQVIPPDSPTDLWVVGQRVSRVGSDDRPSPRASTLAAPVLVLPQELEGLDAHLLDLASTEPAAVAGRVFDEIVAAAGAGAGGPRMIAWRQDERWVREVEATPIAAEAPEARRLPDEPVVLVTGGLGRVGLHLAEHLFRTRGARLALLSRTPLPPHAERAAESELSDGDPRRHVLERLDELERDGAEILHVVADVTDRPGLDDAVAEARRRFGRIDCVLHAAGKAGEETVRLVADLDLAQCDDQMAAKTVGTENLETVLGDEPALYVLFSSNVTMLGGLGSLAYTAANLYLDAFAQSRADGGRWTSIAWDGWGLEALGGRVSTTYQTSMDRYVMTAEESRQAFDRAVFAAAVPRLVVSTGDLQARLDEWLGEDGDGVIGPAAVSVPRPSLGTRYLAPETEMEERVARVWSDLLGLEEVGVEDNFFDLGGNSLLGIKVINRLKRETGREIPVTRLFEGPTVRALAVAVGRDVEMAPDYDESQDRGERRRSRRGRRRARVGEG